MNTIPQVLLEKLKRVLFPDFTNRLTWLFGLAGTALIGGPTILGIIGELSADIYGLKLNLEMFTQDRSGLGLVLCGMALLQNIAYQLKGALSEAYAIKQVKYDNENEILSLKEKLDNLDRGEESKNINYEKREHDKFIFKRIQKIFPYEPSRENLLQAADVGISWGFQEQLEDFVNTNQLSFRLYNEELEEKRARLWGGAAAAQAKFSEHLNNDPRFNNRYAPYYEMKHDGRREQFESDQDEMKEACRDLIHAYDEFISASKDNAIYSSEH